MIEAGGFTGFYPAQIIGEIGALFIEKRDPRAEEYLRTVLNDRRGYGDVRLAAFVVLLKRIVPEGLASEKTLDALSAFEKDPTNAEMIAVLPKKK
jgi:hypothetical protein